MPGDKRPFRKYHCSSCGRDVELAHGQTVPNFHRRKDGAWCHGPGPYEFKGRQMIVVAMRPTERKPCNSKQSRPSG